MSALAGTISSPWTANRGPSAAWWLRSLVSLLAAVGILAIALPSAFGSGSRGGGVDPVQVFSSGSLIEAGTSGGGQLSFAGMSPGQSRSATIDVSNPGSDTAAFGVAARVVDRIGSGGTPLSDALVLRIESSSGAPIYDGSIGAMPRLGLGSIPAGATRAYRFTATLPRSAGNEVAGSSLSAGFTWIAG